MDRTSGSFAGFHGNSSNPNVNSLQASFNGYDDTAYNQSDLTSPLFADDKGDFNFSLDGQDLDPSDHKRRRIARACDLCRRRKIKCDGRLPCSHCKNYNSECVYHFEQKARKPVKTAKYIEGLENRLGRMEHLLRLSGLLGEKEEGKTDLSVLEQRLAQRAASDRSSPSAHSDRVQVPKHRAALRTSPPVTSTPSPGESNATVKTEKEGDSPDMDALADMMDSLVTNNYGETRYIGSSSGFSIFSPQGVQWVSSKLGDNSFQEMISAMAVDDNKWYHWRPEIFQDIFKRQVYTPLPPRDECTAMIVEYFENFNNLFPLFHEPTFMHLVEKQYSDEPYEGSGWWASFNVALAISYKTLGLKKSLPSLEKQSWSYFKNALAVLNELTLRNTDLLSVQALLGMTLFLQGTPNPHPSFMLVGSAIRVAHSIGLHKRGSAYGFNEQELEQRKRVFWIAYMMDKDISLRSGRPAAQDDDDWNVDLPSENPSDGVGDVPVPDGSGKVNLFRKFAEFGVINGKVYRRLYSVKATKQTDGELLATISELDQELEQWKDSLPADFQPEHGLTKAEGPLLLHLTLLHLGYYNSLTTIHRRSIHHGYWTGRLAQYAIEGRNVTPLNHRVFSSAALCVTAARMSIALLNYIPQDDYTLMWLILYYPISALVTLFANILQNPQDPHARPDLRLMHVVVDRLALVAKDDNTGSMQRMCGVCREFARIASAVLDKAERDMSARQKRKQERDREKLAKVHERLQQKNVISSAQLKPEVGNTQDMFQQQQQPPLGMPSMTENQAAAPYSPEQLHNNLQRNSNAFNPALFSSLQSDNLFDPTQPAASNLLSVANLNANVPRSSSMTSIPDFSQADYSYQFGDSNMGGGTGGAAASVSSNGNNPYSPDDNNFNFGSSTGAMFNAGSFQQPFVPHDLWSAPMTFEWDWADLANMPSS